MRTSAADEATDGPVPLSHASTIMTGPTRVALAALGDAIRQAGPHGWCRSMMGGESVATERFEQGVSPAALEALVEAGLAVVDDGVATLAVTIVEIGSVLAVIPKYAWGDEVVYVGPDSAHLIEAVLRLAPRGERAADLGTGTGLLASLLAGRYRTVIGTDLAPSVVAAADLTFALNRVPAGHAVAACLTDVGAGLRPGAFDLVAANAPWVPLAASDLAPRELFAHGGEIGTELPRRFLREGASLLRPGGIAITLALDVELRPTDGGEAARRDAPVDAVAPAERADARDVRPPDGEIPAVAAARKPCSRPDDAEDRAVASQQRMARPLGATLGELVDDGFVVAVLPTPFNREKPELVASMQGRQPLIADATHVAVVVARPRHRGDDRGSLLVAVAALRTRWASNTLGSGAWNGRPGDQFVHQNASLGWQ